MSSFADIPEGGLKYRPTGKPVTAYERELLTILMEESAGVIQAASKVLRFGKADHPPECEYSNTTLLAHELGELGYVYKLLVDCCLIHPAQVATGRDRKRERLAHYMQTSNHEKT